MRLTSCCEPEGLDDEAAIAAHPPNAASTNKMSSVSFKAFDAFDDELKKGERKRVSLVFIISPRIADGFNDTYCRALVRKRLIQMMSSDEQNCEQKCSRYFLMMNATVCVRDTLRVASAKNP